MKTENQIFRIYGKHKTDKRFSALGSNGLVGAGNLIYAYFWNTVDEGVTKERLQDKVDNLNIDNPEFKFELREVK